jgi:bacillolysin
VTFGTFKVFTNILGFRIGVVALRSQTAPRNGGVFWFLLSALSGKIEYRQICHRIKMADSFLSVQFHVGDKTQDELAALEAPANPHRGVGAIEISEFESDEKAARFYCERVLARDNRAEIRALTSPDPLSAAPDLALRKVHSQKQTSTRIVIFEQTRSSIPVFGSNVVVELNESRKLVSIEAELAHVQEVSPIPSLLAERALESIAKFAGVADASLELDASPTLVFFNKKENNTWHLAWWLKKVPLPPPGAVDEILTSRRTGSGLGSSPRDLHIAFNYLVDAHSGEILFHYSAVPTVGEAICKCKGVDELGFNRIFYGTILDGSAGFEMSDSLRAIKTYDLNFGDVEDPTIFPTRPCCNSLADWGNTNTAAVSAHWNATVVYDFYKSVLMRDGVDDNGMDLISVVNCTYKKDQEPPAWCNAYWYDNRMWYGQILNQAGQCESLSRHLDIMAHELTHGVTDHCVGLVYKDESGALNESLSDIFGVIINNWDRTNPQADVSAWRWEIGSGLSSDDLPLRDMSNPKRTGDPDHMENYVPISADQGGVHRYSNIHNKAAHNVLTSKDEAGYVFNPVDVAVLYYLALQRLSIMAKFAQMLQTLVDVAKTFYAGDRSDRDRKIGAIYDAYQKAGINRF